MLFPPLGLPVEIIIPPIIINTNEMIKIAVTNIFVRLDTKTGKAVSQVTLVSPGPWLAELSSIQFPIKGTLVLRDIPQQTQGALHDVQVPLIFLVQVGQEHIQTELIFQLFGGLQGAHEAAPFNSLVVHVDKDQTDHVF